ncbi:MAG: hypothetical protein DRO09_04245 [Thermoprotei archaeon]|nr:MAG: hypothetical protein DRO09_04245 [Thermoprotei archaeon]
MSEEKKKGDVLVGTGITIYERQLKMLEELRATCGYRSISRLMRDLLDSDEFREWAKKQIENRAKIVIKEFHDESE